MVIEYAIFTYFDTVTNWKNVSALAVAMVAVHYRWILIPSTSDIFANVVVLWGSSGRGKKATAIRSIAISYARSVSQNF